MPEVLKVLRCEGVRPDSLGSYLAGLGLLAVASKEWPEVRGCWRNGHYALCGRTIDRSSLEKFLLDDWQPTPYDAWWADIQKADTKARSDRGIWRGRSEEADIQNVRLLDSHIVGVGRNQFNPVFGTGGNIGKRKLAKVATDASKQLKSASEKEKGDWLRMTLWGDMATVLPRLQSAGTWFVVANKTFNSGQDWYREGRLSPWSFLLALEGALLLTGGAGRRLGSRDRPYAVFPFVSDSASPVSAGEVGLAKAEFWAPIWEAPATLTEVRALLERGLARIRQRAAGAPHEFALAARTAGVDAGVKEFVRFVLRQTTSSQVYEAIPQARIAVNTAEVSESSLVLPLIPWLNRLPYEPRDSKQRGKFKGLRGPIENAIIEIAAQPEDAELWRRLLLLLAETQARIDRNKSLRDRCVALPRLPAKLFRRAWPAPTDEIVVAQAIASVGSGSETPLQTNIYGVEVVRAGSGPVAKKWRVGFPKRRSLRAVWSVGDPVRTLCEVLHRRLVDAGIGEILPLGGPCPCPPRVVSAFLNNAIDVEVACRWIPALSLIDWGCPRPGGDQADEYDTSRADGSYLLHSLFRPFFHAETIRLHGDKLFPDHLAPKAVAARRLLNLIRQGAWEEAAALARGRYLAAGHAIIPLPSGLQADGERMAAAMLIPVSREVVVAGLRRWLRPSKKNESPYEEER